MHMYIICTCIIFLNIHKHIHSVSDQQVKKNSNHNPGSIALLGQFWEKIAGLGPWDPVCIPNLG